MVKILIERNWTTEELNNKMGKQDEKYNTGTRPRNGKIPCFCAVEWFESTTAPLLASIGHSACPAPGRKNGATQLDPQHYGIWMFPLACTRSWLRALNPPTSWDPTQVLHNTSVVPHYIYGPMALGDNPAMVLYLCIIWVDAPQNSRYIYC